MSTKTLWKHQEEAIRKAKDKDYFAFLHSPGCGKTRTVLEVLRGVYNEAKCLHKTLIVSPLITHRNWVNEISAFTKIDLQKVGILEGSQIKRCEIMAKQFLLGHKKIAIINYEALAVMPSLVEAILKWAPDVVVADEFHKVKDATSKTSKSLCRIGDQAVYRYGLTGTPILRSPMDIFGQWRFLDKGKVFGTNFFMFRAMYFYDKNAGMPKAHHFPNWQPRPRAVPEIEALMQPFSSVAKKEDVLDLPPLIKVPVEVELNKEQRRNYDELKHDFITWLKEQEGPEAIVVNTALVKALRMLQITSGFISDGNTDIVYKDNPKDKALDELLDSLLPNKIIIWSCFIRNYESIRRVAAKHRVQWVECHGEISNAKKFEAVERFNSDPDVKIFIGHPASLGIGINLVAAKYMIYYSRGYSLEHDIQSEARNYRGGSEIHDKVTRYDLIAKNTIDEVVLAALAKKQAIGAELLQKLAVDG